MIVGGPADTDDLWSYFGFEDNPYRFDPLRFNEKDARLFTGRDAEAAEFFTMMETKAGGIVELSGGIGVGKTSFFNVQQYRMNNNFTGTGLKLLPCRNLVPIADETATSFGHRIVQSAIKNVEDECGKAFPKELIELRDWLANRPVEKVSTLGITLLGTGGSVSRTVSFPSLTAATMENWVELLEAVVSVCRVRLSMKGLVICLDNAETLSKEKLSRLLMDCRDRLFLIEYVWWVIIGASGIYQSISRADARIYQRIVGTGIEIPPLSSSETHALVEARIREYGKQTTAVSPLSERIHDLLFSASRGTVRFVLNTGDTLVRKIVTDVRMRAMKRMHEKAATAEFRGLTKRFLERAIKDQLMDNRPPDAESLPVLKKMAVENVEGWQLSEKQLALLARVGDREFSVEDYMSLECESETELEQTLVALCPDGHGEPLLYRRAEKGKVFFGLHGFGRLWYDLRSSIATTQSARNEG